MNWSSFFYWFGVMNHVHFFLRSFVVLCLLICVVTLMNDIEVTKRVVLFFLLMVATAAVDALIPNKKDLLVWFLGTRAATAITESRPVDGLSPLEKKMLELELQTQVKLYLSDQEDERRAPLERLEKSQLVDLILTLKSDSTFYENLKKFKRPSSN